MTESVLGLQRSNTIDVLRCLAAVSIVIQHVSAEGMLSQTPGAATLLNALSLWGLPFFFLVSGFVQRRHLAARSERLGVWALSRSRRLLIPYVGWSVIYIGIPWLTSIWTNGPPPSYDWSSVVFTGGAFGPLWFLPMLFYVSVVARVLGPSRRLSSFGVSAAAAAAVFVGLTVGVVSWGFWLLMPWYLFLYVGGSLIPDAARRFKRVDGRACVALFATLLALTAVLSAYIPHTGPQSAYATLVTVVPAAAAAVLLWGTTGGLRFSWGMNSAGLTTLLVGVYLSHAGWLVLWKRLLRPELTPWIVWLPLTSVAIVALAFGTSALFQRLPGLRAIT